MIAAFVALGANLGDAERTVRAALDALNEIGETLLLQASSLYRSGPVNAPGPDYINAVAEIETKLDAVALLRELQAIETAFGRKRPYRHAPRTLDLDLLLFGDLTLDSPELKLPHPRLLQRAFVLHPLLEIAPDIVIPGYGPADQFVAHVSAQPIRRLPAPG